jgi:general secretion pathway protein L
MTGLGAISSGYGAWMDAVAGAAVAAAGRLAFPRRVQVVEDASGGLVVRKGKDPAPVAVLKLEGGTVVGPVPEPVARLVRGSRIGLLLQPQRFLFPPLDLPRRAAEFLGGVVRSQIDRLTPWPAEDAVFGFGQPTGLDADRISVTVAATARDQVTPFVHALSALGAASIAVSVTAPDNAPIALLLDQTSRPALPVGRVRRVLSAILVVAALAAAGAVGTAALLSVQLADKKEELARRITERRIALRAGSAGGAAPTALARLEQRKHATPSSVIALEILSQILPDHTYVTELRVEGDKVRLSGLTRDAPALIRLMEQSPHFTRATFFAPTTRSQSDPGERFHIEAQMQPVFSQRS